MSILHVVSEERVGLLEGVSVRVHGVPGDSGLAITERAGHHDCTYTREVPILTGD